MENEQTVNQVYNTFTDAQKIALSVMAGFLQSMNEDQLKVASFLFSAAVEEEVRKRARRTG